MSDSQPPIFTPAHDPYAALRSRDYRLFAGAGFLSVVGGQILSITALYEVYQKTNSKMSLGWVGAALAVPMLVLALPAGHYADHHSRRRISVVTLLVAVVTAVALAALSHYWHDWIHSVGAIYVLLMLGNAAATFGRPARTALLPQLVPPEIFANAVTWNTSLFETASMIGPLIGGYLCAWNIAAAYLLTAILWVVSAILLAALPELPPSTPRNSRPAFADLIAGLKFVFSTRLMLGAMTLDMFAVLFGGSRYVFPAVAQDIFHLGAIGLAWMNTAPAIGAFTMAIIQAHRPPWRHAGHALLICVAGFGAATIVFGLSKNFGLTLVMLALTGAFDNVSVVVRHTLVQMLTPDSMRGRVSAVNQIFIGSSNEIGGFESGVTAEWLGTVPSIVVGGFGTLLVVAGVTALFPQLRKLGALHEIRPLTPDSPAAESESAVAAVTK